MKNILLHEGNIFLVYQVLGRSKNAKDWFRFASDRKGGRKRKAEKEWLKTDQEQEGSDPEDAIQDQD